MKIEQPFFDILNERKTFYDFGRNKGILINTFNDSADTRYALSEFLYSSETGINLAMQFFRFCYVYGLSCKTQKAEVPYDQTINLYFNNILLHVDFKAITQAVRVYINVKYPALVSGLPINAKNPFVRWEHDFRDFPKLLEIYRDNASLDRVTYLETVLPFYRDILSRAKGQAGSFDEVVNIVREQQVGCITMNNYAKKYLAEQQEVCRDGEHPAVAANRILIKKAKLLSGEHQLLESVLRKEKRQRECAAKQRKVDEAEQKIQLLEKSNNRYKKLHAEIIWKMLKADVLLFESTTAKKDSPSSSLNKKGAMDLYKDLVLLARLNSHEPPILPPGKKEWDDYLEEMADIRKRYQAAGSKEVAYLVPFLPEYAHKFYAKEFLEEMGEKLINERDPASQANAYLKEAAKPSLEKLRKVQGFKRPNSELGFSSNSSASSSTVTNRPNTSHMIQPNSMTNTSILKYHIAVTQKFKKQSNEEEPQIKKKLGWK